MNRNFCVPLAISAITGISAGKSISVCSDVRTTDEGVELDAIPWLLDPVGCEYELRVSYKEGRQFRSVLKELDDSKVYLLCIGNKRTGHAVTVRRGKIVDFTEPTSRQKVLACWEITEGAL